MPSRSTGVAVVAARSEVATTRWSMTRLSGDPWVFVRWFLVGVMALTVIAAVWHRGFVQWGVRGQTAQS